jgi:hypothetical protein
LNAAITKELKIFELRAYVRLYRETLKLSIFAHQKKTEINLKAVTAKRVAVRKNIVTVTTLDCSAVSIVNVKDVEIVKKLL